MNNSPIFDTRTTNYVSQSESACTNLGKTEGKMSSSFTIFYRELVFANLKDIQTNSLE